MKLMMTIVWWGLTLFTAFLCLAGVMAIASGKVLPAIFFILALVAILPPVQPLLRSKLPLLKNSAVRLIAWFLLLTTGTVLVSSGAPMLREVSICSAAQKQGICQNDIGAFVKNTKTLYISAIPKDIPKDATVKLDLLYSAEPGKEVTLENTTTKLNSSDGKAKFTFTPKTLPVGSYQLKIDMDAKEFVGITKPFTVWDSDQEVKARLTGNLSNSSTRLSGLKLCDRAQDEPCKTDSSSFKAGTKALGFRLEVTAAENDSRFKLTWRYLNGPVGKDIVLSSSTKTLEKRTGWIDYSLTNQQGFEPGTYELLIAMESKNASPIRREFTVVK